MLEGEIEAKFLETSRLAPGGELTAECADLYKQVPVCMSSENLVFSL